MKPNITSRTIYAFALSLALIGTAADANAAALVCNAASEGVIVYNKDHKIMQFCDGTRWLGMSGASAPGVLPGLTSTNIWVGNGSNAATAVTMSGDATLSNEGALTIANNAVTNAKMADDAVGIAELSATGTPSAITYLRGDNTWATVSTGLPTLTSANIWVGNGSNAATAVTMSGDATLSNAGVLTIGSNAVGSAEITDGSVANVDLAGSIALSKLSITGPASSSVFLRGDGMWAAPAGDNLGNHTATANLAMGTYGITSSAGTIIDGSGGWHRTYGNTGWYNETYGGGWYMTDTTWVRAYNNKSVFANGAMRADGNFYIHNGSPTIYLADTDHRSAMIHNNSNLLYFLSGCGNDSETWCQQANSYWPLYLNLNNNDAVFGGNVYAFNYYHNSDARLKKDVKPLTSALDLVARLQGVSYVWKDSGQAAFGLIAQDVQKVLPTAVRENGNGHLAVDYDQIIAPLVEAVKVLRAENAELRDEFEAYKAVHP